VRAHTRPDGRRRGRVGRGSIASVAGTSMHWAVMATTLDPHEHPEKRLFSINSIANSYTPGIVVDVPSRRAHGLVVRLLLGAGTNRRLHHRGSTRRSSSRSHCVSRHCFVLIVQTLVHRTFPSLLELGVHGDGDRGHHDHAADEDRDRHRFGEDQPSQTSGSRMRTWPQRRSTSTAAARCTRRMPASGSGCTLASGDHADGEGGDDEAGCQCGYLAGAWPCEGSAKHGTAGCQQ
jgi:hypothetical protein